MVATHTGAAGYGGVRSTGSVNSGKVYAEFYLASGTYALVGLATLSANLGAFLGSDAFGYGYYQNTGEKGNSGLTAFGAAYSAAQVIGVAYDADAGEIWFAKNNVWQASGNPAAGANPAFSGVPSGLHLATTIHDVGSVMGLRCRASDFTYTPPSGFSAWESAGGGGGGFDATKMLSVF